MNVLEVDELSVRLSGHPVLNKISFAVAAGEQWAITGPSGSGKTTLLKAIAGRVSHTGIIKVHELEVTRKKIVLVEQQHHFKNLSNTNNFYYQQRFNSSDSEDAITVEEALQMAICKTKSAEHKVHELVTLFDLKKLFSEPLIQLSNGENKRLQIVKALLLQPAVLLLDNPFTGLDTNSRTNLTNLLTNILKEGVHIMLTTSASHIPDFITHVLSLGNGQEYEIREIAAFKGHAFVNKISSQNDVNILMTSSTQPSFEFAVRMRNVSVQYGGRRILDTVDWEVRNGERWALSGPNGSGKSTLLSLVNADNPQAYANDIYLFDRKRGTGETIWEIKKKIGFLSPELHLYFEKSISCFNTVASGLFDTIGLFRKLTAEQSALVTRWIRVLSLEHVSNKFLFQLSHGQQRLVLLARALVKNPPLLILDEPCQGLDDDQVGFFKDAINKICLAGNKTLIYVSHYPEEIPYCVTRFIRLENGKVTYG